MARIFSPVVPPNDPRQCAPWLNKELRRISGALQQQGRGLSAVARGEAPDASGTPLVDLTGVFLLAGRIGNQLGYGGTMAGGSLTLSSTSSPTKGFIYLGSAQTSMFDETNQRLGLNTTPLARLHQKHTANEMMVRWEGPTNVSVASCICNGTTTVTHGSHGFTLLRVGMLVYGPGVSSGTQISAIASDASMTVSATITAGTVTLTFADSLDLSYGLSASDYQLKSSSSIVFFGSSLLGGQVVGVRFTSQNGTNSLPRGWVEGQNVTQANMNLSFAGQNGSNGNSFESLFNYVTFNTWDATNHTSAAHVGINIDPYEYSASAANAQPDSLIVARRTGATSGIPAIIIEGASSTEYAWGVTGASGGVGPPTNRTIGAIVLAARFDGKLQFGGGTDATSVKLTGDVALGQGTFTFTNKNNRTILGMQSGRTAWSDSATTAVLQLSNTTDDGFRAIIDADLNNILARLGLAATAVVIGGGVGTLPAPAAGIILTLFNGTGTLGLDITRLTAARTLSYTDNSGFNVTDKNVLMDTSTQTLVLSDAGELVLLLN